MASIVVTWWIVAFSRSVYYMQQTSHKESKYNFVLIVLTSVF